MTDIPNPVRILTSIGRTLYRRRSSSKAASIASLISVGIGGLALGYLVGHRRGQSRAPAVLVRRPPITQATVGVNPADTPIGAPGRNDEERLDEAIQESFPGSDPVSVRIE